MFFSRNKSANSIFNRLISTVKRTKITVPGSIIFHQSMQRKRGSFVTYTIGIRDPGPSCANCLRSFHVQANWRHARVEARLAGSTRTTPARRDSCRRLAGVAQIRCLPHATDGGGFLRQYSVRYGCHGLWLHPVQCAPPSELPNWRIGDAGLTPSIGRIVSRACRCSSNLHPSS
jgi:hypothetical protein